MKLAELFAIADKLGAARVATGHYARVVRDESGAPRLAMGADRSKDQSYFLYATPARMARAARLPARRLDEAARCAQEAVARALPGAAKGESQELCFAGSGAHAYADFVAERAGARVRPGVIVDEEGRTVGAHEGVHRFTIGQRSGLGVALGRPAFVTRIDAESGTVHLGGEDSLRSRSAGVADVCLADGVALPLRAKVRVRYRHEGDAALVTAAEPGGARVVFDAPVRAVTRGQVAVFYDGDRVLGGGRIVSVPTEGAHEGAPEPAVALRS